MKVLIDSEIFEKIKKVLNAAKTVVPTSEACPLKPALEELAKCIDDKDAEDFMRRVNARQHRL